MNGDDPARPSHGPRARLLLAGAVLLAALAWRWGYRRAPAPPPPQETPPRLPTRLAPQALSPAEADKEAEPLSGYKREVVRPKPVQGVPERGGDAAAEEPDERTGGPSSRRRDDRKTLPEIFRMPGEPRPAPSPSPPAAQAPARRGPPAAFAPFGRLVKCQLVEALDSVTARSEPIVALVTQDLDWNGAVIIPAGTEAFSYARPEALIDAGGAARLVDTGEWTLVLPADRDGLENGRELILRARAIDRSERTVSERAQPGSWGVLDGADGLVGVAVSTLDNREIKLFAAAAISGMSQGVAAVAERQQAAPGLSGALGATVAAPTLGNAAEGAASAGAVDVANEYASRIRDEISKRGTYVRVAAGKEFYLFVEQTIDPGTAEVGLRLPGRSPTPR